MQLIGFEPIFALRADDPRLTALESEAEIKAWIKKEHNAVGSVAPSPMLPRGRHGLPGLVNHASAHRGSSSLSSQ